MRSRVALLVIPALLLAMLPGAASAAPGRAADAAAAREHARILAYWTPERMAAAQPRELAFDPVRGFHPAAKPPGTPGGGGGGGGGGGTTSVVTGASYNGGGAMLKASGRAYFTFGSSAYICSGAVVNDTNANRSVVLTAGHCVMENDGQTWATNFLFIPSFDTAPTYTCAQTTYGCWTATAIYGDTQFLNAGGFNTQATVHDWAFVVVGAGGKGGSVPAQLDAAVGSFPISFSGPGVGDTVSAFGYPAAGKYKGKDLVYCRGPLGQDGYNSNLTWSLGCDMTGGSSGGPWVTGTDYTSYDLVLRSVNSYGYSGVKNMYGPKFTARTQAAFDAANALSNPAPGSGVVRTTYP